ncbi:U6 snRNA phosphodiesterase Usb1 [Hypoxylon sp. FL1284]|nr:U6 snRNA phosphodiesterase Usb1 [Hypoxylon sp. FL1284]
MALVDYSSSDSDEPEPAAAAKRRKTSSHGTPPPASESILPPLPAAFHNLYASTVRVSTADDPALHQGRKRVNPHKVGSWPSHLYIEWHPTAAEHATLSKLVAALRAELSLPSPLDSFLTSDLGAPQPLHVSLSRPVVLGTAQRDSFLKKLGGCIARASVSSFALAPRALAWHRSSESARSFLVLRVCSAGEEAGTTAITASSKSSASRRAAPRGGRNPELSKLLAQCNAAVEEEGQPALYAYLDGSNDNDDQNQNGGGGGVDDAFHISIAWTFAEPTAEVRQRTERVFCGDGGGVRDEVLTMRVPVDGVKAKIGNAVTHISLPVRGKRGREE